MLVCPQCATPIQDAVGKDDPVALSVCPKCQEALVVERVGTAVRAREAVPPPLLKDRIAPGSVMAGIFECLEESLDHLPTVPEAPQRVIRAIHDPLSTSAELAQIINEDAALSMRVLKLANSVFSSSRHPITDLKLACARLGNRTLANVAHMVAHGQLYRSVNPAYHELMHGLWRHSVATARLADVFARHVDGVHAESVFLAGLTHDIGKPVLLDVVTNQYKGRLGRLRESSDLLNHTLSEFAPYAGLRIVQHWAISPPVPFTTFYAQCPDAAPEHYRRDVHLVAFASDVADFHGYGVVGRQSPDLDGHKAFGTLDPDSLDLRDLAANAAAHVDPYLEVTVAV